MIINMSAEMVISPLSNGVFNRWNARDLHGCVLREPLDRITGFPWRAVVQTLHCGGFTLCHLVVMGYIAVCPSYKVFCLQVIYVAVATTGKIAIMTTVFRAE